VSPPGADVATVTRPSAYPEITFPSRSTSRSP